VTTRDVPTRAVPAQAHRASLADIGLRASPPPSDVARTSATLGAVPVSEGASLNSIDKVAAPGASTQLSGPSDGDGLDADNA
jgi:hypothetical protein